MRFPATLIGGLLGVVPGLLLVVLGQVVAGGGDGVTPFTMGGVALMVVGFVVGAVWGAPLDPFARATVGAIVGMGAGYVWLIYNDQNEVNTFAVMGGIFFVLVSLMVFTGNWVATAFATAVAGGVGILTWVGERSVLAETSRADFWPMWLWVVCTVATLVLGLTASTRIYRGQSDRAVLGG